MKQARRNIAAFLSTLCLALGLCACGGTPWQYNPGAPGRPTGVVATGGNGQVTLNWSPAPNAAKYNVYYSTSPGVSASNGLKIPYLDSTTATVSGLTNNSRYYFAVTAVNEDTATNTVRESPLSSEALGVPAEPGPFRQSDLQGTWRFNALVSGAGARWMRGTVAIDAVGTVSVTSFSDSLGNTVAPATLFSTMTMLPDGTVLQVGAAAAFHGTLSANLYKDMLVATGSAGGGTAPMIVVLRKTVPGITFSAADIKGTGRLVAGPLQYVYHQLSSGAVSEWEYASCQVGQDQAVTYLSLNATTPRQLPGNGSKVVTLSITADGIVTETPIAGIAPQPAALITQGVMSADKMTIVGTATDSAGASVLRVMQLVHPPSVLLTSSSYALADLAGSYAFHSLAGGVDPLWANGTWSVAASGGASFPSYSDSSGNLAVPGSSLLAMDQQGVVSEAAAPTYNGQFSYLKDMVVATQTDAAGGANLSISLKR